MYNIESQPGIQRAVMHFDKFTFILISTIPKAVLATNCGGTTLEQCGDACVNRYCEYPINDKFDCGECCCYNDHDGGCWQNCPKKQLDYHCPPGQSVYHIRVHLAILVENNLLAFFLLPASHKRYSSCSFCFCSSFTLQKKHHSTLLTVNPHYWSLVHSHFLFFLKFFGCSCFCFNYVELRKVKNIFTLH